MATPSTQVSPAKQSRLSARFGVWLCGLLLAGAIASYLAARVYTINQTVRVLGDDESVWSAQNGVIPDGLALWERLSLVACVTTALLYLAALLWYHLKRR